MKITPFSTLAAAALVGGSFHVSAATVSWGMLDGPGDFVQSNVVDLNGAIDSAASNPISFSAGSGAVAAQTSALVFETSGVAQAVFTTGGSDATEGVSGGGMGGSEPAFGLIGAANQNATSTGIHGGIIGGMGQPSALAFGVFGGPLEQANTANVLGLNIDFSGFSGGSVTGVNFSLAAITSTVTSATSGGRDVVRLTILDENGAPIPLTNTMLTTDADPTFTIAGLGTGEVTFTGDDADVVTNDHSGADALRSNVGIDLGAEEVSSISIEFAPEINGTFGSNSAGFAVGDIDFQAVPEPSAALLGVVGLLGFIRRKR